MRRRLVECRSIRSRIERRSNAPSRCLRSATTTLVRGAFPRPEPAAPVSPASLALRVSSADALGLAACVARPLTRKRTQERFACAVQARVHGADRHADVLTNLIAGQ